MIRCFPAFLGSTPALPRWTLANRTISDYFHDNSGGDIQLVGDASRTDMVRRLEDVTDSLVLHSALGALVNDFQRGAAIGLIFARRYRPYPDALGVMFDRGFATQDDPYGAANEFAIPRQGCAVFLDKIAAVRGGYGAAAVDEALYTAIHELGHVFNLVHNFQEPNFMAGSATAPRPIGFLKFTDADKMQLASCSRSSAVAPGGAPFRDRNGSYNSIAASRPSRPTAITLDIDLVRRPILPFEPLELDITIRAEQSGPGATVPDEIDPGYPRFRIWIERPSGERTLYRSPRHYCPSGRTFRLRAGEVFRRDVSIFGQSGGYTFASPGEYRIYAELDVAPRQTIRSRKRTLEVVAPGPQLTHRSVLARPEVARVLYYRRAALNSRGPRILREFRTDHRRDPNGAFVDYSLGRLYAMHAQRAKRADTRDEHARVAKQFLRRAADHAFLGKNARRRAQDLLVQL